MNSSEAPVVSSQDAVALKFTVTCLDLIKCRFWRLNHHPSFLGLYLFFSAFVPLRHWNDAVFAGHPFLFKAVVIGRMMAMMFGLIVSLNLLFQILLILFNENQGLVGPMELQIQADGLVQRTGVSQSLHRWAGFQKIRSSRNYFFLYVTESNALYIPKRCFASEAEPAAFVEQVRAAAGKR